MPIRGYFSHYYERGGSALIETSVQIILGILPYFLFIPLDWSKYLYILSTSHNVHIIYFEEFSVFGINCLFPNSTNFIPWPNSKGKAYSLFTCGSSLIILKSFSFLSLQISFISFSAIFLVLIVQIRLIY